MLRLSRFLYLVGVLVCQVYFSYGCLEIKDEIKNISDSHFVFGISEYRKCWTIVNPEKKQLYIKLEELNLMNKSASQGSLTLEFEDEQRRWTVTYWSQSVLEKVNTTASLIQIVFSVSNGKFPDGYKTNFTLYFDWTYIECSHEDSFHCSSDLCIRKTEVCNGIEDCEDGVDEVGCGMRTIKGVAEALSKEVSWIKSKRTSSWGWRENTPRIVAALYLAGYAKFDGTNLEEELMAKQTKLKTLVSLSKNSLSREHLSMLINGLLITCHNPRHFFGQNLIERLEEEMDLSNNFNHPLIYLTLCNANESWPTNAKEDLYRILNITNSFYEFFKDYKAIAVMALSCYESRTALFSRNENVHIKTKYDDTLCHFKEMQLSDGSFGNFHTTSLITQALISSGQEKATDWKINATIHYLMEKLKMPHDLLASYLVLPVLNTKSLSDISKVNCSFNPQRKGYDSFISEMSYYEGPKMRVQYSLYVGDKKDVIHTISLLAPVNCTAYDIMELAATEDYKFIFKHKNMYVYQIGEVTNDSEAGLFWFLYKGFANATSSINRCIISPDQEVMQEKEHIVMWYKKNTF